MTLALDSLNLDFQESKVYIVLIALGPLSLGEIVKNVEFSIEDTRKYMQSLKEKGYVFEIPGIETRFRAILPFDALKVSAESAISQMEKLGAGLDEYISQKLSIITTKLREESSKISEGVAKAREEIKKAEMKAEGDTEARIARHTLELEQTSDQTKDQIKNTFQEKEKGNQEIFKGMKETSQKQIDNLRTVFNEVNNQVAKTFSEGLDDSVTQVEEKTTEINEKVGESVNTTLSSLEQGIQNVQNSMGNTGQVIFSSIDERNTKLSSHLEKVSENIKKTVTDLSHNTQAKSIGYLEEFNKEIQQKIDVSKKEIDNTLNGTKEEIISKSIGSTGNLQQTLSDVLIKAQNQINDAFAKSRELLNQQVQEARAKIEESIGQFSEAVSVQTDSDIQKLIINAESTLAVLSSDTQSVTEKTKESISSNLTKLVNATTSSVESTKKNAVQELNTIVENLKKEVQSIIEGFNQELAPQEKEIRELLSNLKETLVQFQNESRESYKKRISEFKATVENKNQLLSQTINDKTNSLMEEFQALISNLNTQTSEYDNNFKETLTESVIKTTERLMGQTREFQEKIISVVNEIEKAAIEQIEKTDKTVASSIQAEISSLETELSDYSGKFKEVTERNEKLLKNYLYSLEKIASLVRDTKQPPVQTAAIISKDATLSYIDHLFRKMKGSITLLIPKVSDIPVDEILETKNHQRVNLVTVMDPKVHGDLLKKLLQKPNVRVRRVDQTKFVGVEKYIAADRDGEEVLIAITEDKGGVVAIASQSEAFVELMGKIILGDYFLARSQEISRLEIGL
ncbi:MAG: helix-turn-helix domain-containing protein [Candidatus Hodarchaeales archaeon]